MAFTIGAGNSGSFGFGVDVPPQEPGNDFGSSSIQFQNQGVNLGSADATTLNFSDNLTATRAGAVVTVVADVAPSSSIQFESNGDPLGGPDATTLNFGANLTAVRVGDVVTVDAETGGGGGGVDTDVPFESTVDNPSADNTPTWNAYLGDDGIFFDARKVKATLAHWGNYIFNGLNDIHPSISLNIDARGGAVFEAGPDLPETNADGAEAAMIRALRRAPPSPSVLAFQPKFSSFYLDGNKGQQSFPVHGIRFPNPNPDENPLDGDPSYNTNKDYVAGRIEFVEITSCSGDGVRVESGNGRLDVHSARALSCTGCGWNLNGNDITMHGHWAAGGNSEYGVKVGSGAGFLMLTGNVWSNPATRSLGSMAVWVNQRRSFAIGFNVLNDSIRYDSGDNFWRGGVTIGNSCAIHDEHFLSEGVAQNVDNDGNPRCQAFFTNNGYRTSDYGINRLQRTTAVNFSTWQNIGGSLNGGNGTAFNWIVDASGGAASNTIDVVNNGPNCRSTTSPISTFTAAGAVLTSNGHGMGDGIRVALHSSNTLPQGLKTGKLYFTVDTDTNTFGLAHEPGGDAIVTSDAGTGVHSWANLDQLPYNARENSTVNFLLMDSHMGETRVGAAGAAKPGYFIAGIADGTAPQVTAVTGDFTVTTTDDRFHCTAHGLDMNYALTVTSTNALPAGLSLSKTYWVVDVIDADTFRISEDYDGHAIDVTDTGIGTHTFHSSKRTYQHELGDSSAHNGLVRRNMLWGAWEKQRASIYNEIAFDKRPATNSTNRTINPYQEAQIFTVTGSGITGPVNINLPTDLPASWTFPVIFTGGSVDSIIWNIVGVGAIQPDALPIPTFSPGFLCVILRYEHTSNQYYVEYCSNESLEFISNSITNLSIHGGPFFRGFTAGENIGSLDLVGVDASGNIVRANAGSGIPAIGLTRKAFSSGATTVAYAKRGLVRRDDWAWSQVGKPVWLSASSSGSLTQTRPSGSGIIQQSVGIALSSSLVDFDIGLMWTML